MQMKDWTNLEDHGVRLLRIILKLNKKFNIEKDIDRQIKLATTICYVTSQCLSISKVSLGLGELLDKKVSR